MNFMKEWIRKDMVCLGLLFLLASALLGFELGKMGFLDPDEPFYSLTAKEMLQSRDPWTPRMFGQPQFEKPILFYWVLYAAFKLLGISEFSARLGPCIAGILTVLVVYLWGRILFKRAEPAFLSAAILVSGGQFIVLSRVVLTDIFLCLFVTASLASFSWGYASPARRLFAWRLFFIFAGLAFLTKGPVGLLIPLSGILVYVMMSGEGWILRSFPWRGGALLFSAVSLPWYAMMAKIHGIGVLSHFFMHENVRRFFVAEHAGMDRWYFYPGVILVGFFPWSAVLAAGFSHAIGAAGIGRSKKTFLFLLSAFLTSFCFFMLAKSKLMSYIFPLYPIAALLAGDWAWRFYRALRLGYSPRPVFGFLTFAVWVLAPAALVAGAYRVMADYGLPIFWPVTAIALTLIPLLWLSFFLLWSKKFTGTLAAMLAAVICFSSLSFGWMMPMAGEAFSSKRWAKDYGPLIGSAPGGLFLASKMFVRGIAFYSGHKNVGVFSGKPKGGFYTAPSIPIFSEAKDLLALNKEEFPVYFLIRKKELRHLLEDLDPVFSISVLEQSRFRILAKLDHA